MTGPDSERDADLHAAADGRIEPADQARVDARLADNPDEAATVYAYRLLNARLHDRFDAVLDEPVPPHLLAVINGGSTPAAGGRPGWRSGLLRLAASVALLIVGGAGGWLLHDRMAPPPTALVKADATFANKAIGAHNVFAAEVRHPVEVPATEEAHLVAWLSKRLGTPLRAPDLNDAGFALVGGRLLADRNLPVAQIMYQNAAGRRLTLYLRSTEAAATYAVASQSAKAPLAPPPAAAFHFVEQDGVAAFYWIDAAFSYALVAPLDRPQMLEIATKVYAALDK